MNHIVSAQNPLIKHLVKLRQSRKLRYEACRVIITGTKVIEELNHTFPIETLLVCEGFEIPNHLKANKILYVSQRLLEKVSGLETAKDFIAEMAMPKPSSLAGCSPLLVLDGVQDPGNVGTLIRSATAFGWQGLFFTDGCSDPFGEKALRASRGALFHIPYRFGTISELQALKAREELTAYVAHIEGRPLAEIGKAKKILLAVGSESSGPSPELFEWCEPLMLPMQGPVESLNVAVAGSIFAYHFSPSIDKPSDSRISRQHECGTTKEQ